MFAEQTTVEGYISRQTEPDKLSPCDARVRFMSFIDNVCKANQEMDAFTYANETAFAWDTSKTSPFIAYPCRLSAGRLAIDSVVLAGVPERLWRLAEGTRHLQEQSEPIGGNHDRVRNER
jgi:hypothetical protein